MVHAGANRSTRSRSRPPRRSARTIQVEYVSGYGPKTNYDPYDSESSDSEYYDRISRQSIHVRANVSQASWPRHRHQERPPRAPPAPGSEPRSPFEPRSSVTPSLVSSSDSRSSRGSSHPHDYSTLSPASDVTPEIVDSPGYRNRTYHTGAYSYGYNAPLHHPSHQSAPVPPKWAPATSVPPPTVIIADPKLEPIPAPAPPARGGPMAGSYLAANAPAQGPAVVEVKEAIPARDEFGQGPRPIPDVHPVIPLEYINRGYSGSSDDDEEEGMEQRLVYLRPRTRGRQQYPVRSPPRSLSRPRSRSRSRARRNHRPNHEHRHNHRKEKRTADLQAQIDALSTRLADVMDNPYATEVIAAEGIKFDPLIKDACENK